MHNKAAYICFKKYNKNTIVKYYYNIKYLFSKFIF